MPAVSDGGAPGDDRIESVTAGTVALPIPRTLHLGPMVVTERQYAVVRVRTTDGLVGSAYGLSREAPVAATVEQLLAPILVGRPADAIAALWDEVYRRTVGPGRTGLVMRALSLVDVALWDIKAKRAGLPLWRLLGGGDPEVPCVMVAGYPTGEGPDAIADHVLQRSAEGHRLLKVARIPAPELAGLLHRAGAGLRAGDQIIVDAAWWWRTAGEATAEIRQWADAAPLAWVEDPFVPEDVTAYRRLCHAGMAPIGVGDELTDRHTARALIDAGIDVLRIDAIAIGGISGAWHLSHVAESAGLPISYHVYPEVHVHLAAASRAPSMAETFGPPDNPFDPAGRLLVGTAEFRPGVAIAPEAPGLGFDLDDELIDAHRVDDGTGGIT